jgi:release factor glutamine methyltransferase
VNPAKLGTVLRSARCQLELALGLDASVAGLEAQVLLGHVLKQSRAYLLAHLDSTLPDSNRAQFEALLTRRAQGEPIAYLTGQREFYGLPFLVTPAVLIPRPETELLVDLALQQIPHATPVHILDLGTGSGAIAISIAKQRPRAQVTAVDCSPDALSVARQNAAHLHCSNVQFIQSDWFAALNTAHPFDLIVSNPPYIAQADPHLLLGDLKSEPALALVGGLDGLAAIRHIASTAKSHLRQTGHLLFEHGYDQGASCREILQTHGWRKIASYIDLAGCDRISGGIL